MQMKIRKTYAAIPEERLTEFMRLFPTARLHAWPNTWSFGTNLKDAVQAFIGNDSIADDAADSVIPPAPSRIASPTDATLTLVLSRPQMHALDQLTRRITAGTVEAFARNPEEKAQMQSAFTELKTVLREELARGKKANTTV